MTTSSLSSKPPWISSSRLKLGKPCGARVLESLERCTHLQLREATEQWLSEKKYERRFRVLKTLRKSLARWKWSPLVKCARHKIAWNWASLTLSASARLSAILRTRRPNTTTYFSTREQLSASAISLCLRTVASVAA